MNFIPEHWRHRIGIISGLALVLGPVIAPALPVGGAVSAVVGSVLLIATNVQKLLAAAPKEDNPKKEE